MAALASMTFNVENQQLNKLKLSIPFHFVFSAHLLSVVSKNVMKLYGSSPRKRLFIVRNKTQTSDGLFVRLFLWDSLPSKDTWQLQVIPKVSTSVDGIAVLCRFRFSVSRFWSSSDFLIGFCRKCCLHLQRTKHAHKYTSFGREQMMKLANWIHIVKTNWNVQTWYWYNLG